MPYTNKSLRRDGTKENDTIHRKSEYSLSKASTNENVYGYIGLKTK